MGGAWSRGGLVRGVPGPGGSAWSGGCLVLGYLVLGALPGLGEGLVETPPRWLLLQAVRILLECILVFIFIQISAKTMPRQEYIPEGMTDRQTPPDRGPMRQRPPPLDRDPPQTEIPLDSDTPGQRPPWTETPSHVTCAVLGQRPPRKQNHNHRQVSKYYLPATSFAGGKSRLAAQTSGFPSGKSCIPRGDRHTDSL